MHGAIRSALQPQSAAPRRVDLTRGAAALVAIIGGGALLGPAAGLPFLANWGNGAAVRPITAWCLLALAFGIGFASFRRFQGLGAGIGAVVAVVAALRLFDVVFGTGIGLDRWLSAAGGGGADPPRMPPAAALALLLAGACLLFTWAGPFRRVVTRLGYGIGAIAFVSLAWAVSGFFPVNAVPVPTGAALLALAAALLDRSELPPFGALSIRHRLTLLVLAAAAPLNLLVLGIVGFQASKAYEAQASALLYAARSLAAAVDGHVARHRDVALALSHSPAATEDDLSAFRAEAARLLPAFKGVDLVIAERDGQMLMNTAAEPGRPLPRRPVMAWQREAVAAGGPVVSDLYLDLPQRGWTTAVEVAILQEGKPGRSLGLLMSPGSFLDLLNAQAMPEGWLAGIIDREGKLIARVPAHDAFLGQLASEPWRRVKDTEGTFDTVSLEGAPLLTANVPSALTGWSVAVGTKKSELEAAALESVRWSLAIGALVCIASLALAAVIARRISDPILQLRSESDRILEGTVPDLGPAPPEILSLRDALAEQARRRRAAEARIATIHAALSTQDPDVPGDELDETVSVAAGTCTAAERQRAVDALGLMDARRVPAYDQITKLAAGVLQAPLSLLTAIDTERQFFVSSYGLSAPLHAARQRPVATSYCRHVIDSGSVVVIRDAARNPIVADIGAWRDGFVAYLGVPVHDRDGITVASLSVSDSIVRRWTLRDLLTLRGIARQMERELETRAAESALRTRNRQLDLLVETSQRLLTGAASERPLLEDVFGAIARAVDMEMFYHFRMTEEPGLMRLALDGGIGRQERERFSTMRFGELLCGRVAERREKLIVEDLQHSDHPGSDVLRAAGATSYAGFPLVPNGELLGTIAFVSRRRTHLSEGDVQTIETICDQVATALERARLQHELRESEQRLRFSLLAAKAGSWKWEIESGRIVWSPENYALYDIDPSPGGPSYADWESRIHPDDLNAANRDVRDVLEGRSPDFKSEFRVVRRDGSVRWLAGWGQVARDPTGRAVIMSGINVDITDRKISEERVFLLMKEVNHRAKNLLAIIQAIARQTAASSPGEFVSRFGDRLRALAHNQDLLVRNAWTGVDVHDLVRAQLDAFADAIGSRIKIAGEPLRFNAATAQVVGLALHELATNASKYGALSTDNGHIDIAWRRIGSTLELSWRERGGPPVAPPQRTGFGTTVLTTLAKAAVAGEVTIEYAPSGLVWVLTCDVATALDQSATSDVASPAAG